MFDSKSFVVAFDKRLSNLQRAEKHIKGAIGTMSRDLLCLLHIAEAEGNLKCGDIGFINRFLGVLSPVNRKVAILFFKAHTGFIFEDNLKVFTKKSKKHYDEVAHTTLDKIKTDPLFDMWSWQHDRVKVEVEPTPFTLDKVRESLTNMVKKADKANISKKEILSAMLDTGFTIQDIIDMLDATKHLDEMMEKIDAQYVEQ